MDNSPVLTTIEENNAPWNGKEDYDGMVRVRCTETLSREVLVPTNADVIHGRCLSDAYNELHYTVSELMQVLQSYIERDIELTAENTGAHSSLVRMLEDCKEWQQLDAEYELLGKA